MVYIIFAPNFTLAESALCKVVPCISDQAKKDCPITCGKKEDPDLCDVAECSTAEARSMCPNKCGDKEGSRQINVP